MKKRSLFLENITIRAEKTDSGAALVGLIPYNSQGSSISGSYKEVITDTAFKRALAEKKQVIALRNHNPDYPLGNTNAGTLTLTSTSEGLLCRCSLPDTSYANDLLRAVEHGDACGMSFGFLPVKEDSKDGVTYLRDVDLHEISYGVTFPFYQEAKASVDVRSAAFELQQLMKRGEVMDDETLTALKTVVETGQKLIDAAEAQRAEHEKKEPPEDKDKEAAENKPADDNQEDAEKKKNEEEERAKKAATLKKRNLQRLNVLAL